MLSMMSLHFVYVSMEHMQKFIMRSGISYIDIGSMSNFSQNILRCNKLYQFATES
jgi:hypothetical protein